MNLSDLPLPGTMGITISNGVGTARVYSENANEIWLSILDTQDVSEVLKRAATSPRVGEHLVGKFGATANRDKICASGCRPGGS